MSEEFKLANGANNSAGLKFLWQLSPPLFRKFRGGLLTEWSDCEERIVNGNRGLTKIGLPRDTWIFFTLTLAEYTYLRDTFGTSVTIRTFDKGAGTFKNFNATMNLDMSKAKWGLNEWNDVRVDFFDLVEI